jgi:hypothetical protein
MKGIRYLGCGCVQVLENLVRRLSVDSTALVTHPKW